MYNHDHWNNIKFLDFTDVQIYNVLILEVFEETLPSIEILSFGYVKNIYISVFQT